MENSHDSTDSQSAYEDVDNEDEKGSSESEENEPKLKYVRISNDLRSILEKDAASCVAIHPKFLCVGTVWGAIYVLDLQGNSILNRDPDPGSELPIIRPLLSHSVAVNQISIDAKGDFIASCSDDGKVFIYGLYSTENHKDISIGRLVRSISIDPFYYKSGSGRRFITGDERLVLHEKTFLSRMKSSVLADASHEGGVKNIKWSPSGELVAWATLLGFRVYDMTAKTSLGLIKWLKKTQVDMKCHLCWKDKGTLLVGWADTVRVCTILERPPSQFTNGLNLSSYLLQPVFTFETDFLVCGVGPMEGGQVVVMGLNTQGEEGVNCGERPHMHVIEPASHDYLDLSTDNLSLRGYQNYTPSNYSLDCVVEENRYVIVSPKDIVVACPYDPDDHIDWLLDHSKYDEALTAVTDDSLKFRHTFLSVGRAYIDHLLALKDYQKGGELCRKVLGNDWKLWEAEISKFAHEQQLRSIITYLPLGKNKLSPHIYDLVLYELLKFEPEGFLKLVKEWPPCLYNVTVVGNAVVHNLKTSEQKYKPILIEALAILYSHEGKYEIALATYLKIQNKGIFELIKKNELYGFIIGILDDLMALDSKQTVATLVQTKDIDPDIVIKKFYHNKYNLYMYLDRLREKESKRCEKYEYLLVSLYADFNREKLKPLLETSSHYPIQEALDICKHRGFHPETALLLEIMGNTKEALSILTHQLGNIEEAVDFCIKHDDIELWLEIINYSKDKPMCVKYLLNRIGNYINPILLIQRVDKKTEIPGLKTCLVKMMQDYNSQVSFMEGCKEILVSDYFALYERLVSTKQRGSYVSDDQFCGVCTQKLFTKSNKEMESEGLRAFHCSHIFHAKCLPLIVESCTICTSHKSNQKQLTNR